MIKFLRKIKFYIKNAIWNYWFWLNCKRKFVEYSFIKKNPINGKREKVVKKRFLGYEYKGKVYIDNPGLPVKNNDEWEIIKKSYK
jgi:hypothetical protein